MQKFELLPKKHRFTYNKLSLNWLRLLPLLLSTISLSPGSSKSVLASEAWTAIPACTRQVVNLRERTETEHESPIAKTAAHYRRKTFSFNASKKIEWFLI
jgi:hypothetical protein